MIYPRVGSNVFAPCGYYILSMLSVSEIESSSNIVFSNGKLDPWHRGGVSYVTLYCLIYKANYVSTAQQVYAMQTNM